MQLIPTRSRSKRSRALSLAGTTARKGARTVTKAKAVKAAPKTATAVWGYRRRIGIRRVLLAGGGVAIVVFAVRKATSSHEEPDLQQPAYTPPTAVPAPEPVPPADVEEFGGPPNEGATGEHPQADDASHTAPHGDKASS